MEDRARDSQALSYRWGAVQELIFLDRYSPKAPRESITVGDVVVVMTSDDPKRPAKEVGVVRGVEGDLLTIELKATGEVLQRQRRLCDKPIELRPEQMWERMADAIVEVEPLERREELRQKFRWLLEGFRFVPGGRINTFLGTGQMLTAYNCYTLPLRGHGPDVPADSRHAIIDSLGNMVEIMARGGGVGINLSVLRPRLAYVKGVNGKSSGSVSWGALFSFATGLVEQGGCFGPGTRIATDKGLIPAAELAYRVEQGEFIQAWTHKGLRAITAAFRNGVKPLYRVTTRRGVTVDITADHRVAVLCKGRLTTVPLRELGVGDEILTLLHGGTQGQYVPLAPVVHERSRMSTTLHEDVRFPGHFDEQLAYLVGYMYGGGYVHAGKEVTWSAPEAIKMAVARTQPDVQETLVRAIQELFGIDAVIEPHGKGCNEVALYSRLVVEWLDQNGLLKSEAPAVRVPEVVFRSPSSVVGAFVAGYFDAGYFDAGGSDRRRKAGYGFDSVSLGMLQDIQLLLAHHGIASHISRFGRSRSGRRNVYRLSITGAESKARFRPFMNHHDSYPAGAWCAMSIPGRYYPGLVEVTKGRISHRALARVQERLVHHRRLEEAQRAGELLHTLPDTIVEIEPIGLSEVYDFEVEEVHLLSGNGVYTSNSRRGALMLILDVWHPDVLEFINAKRDFQAITNANISVGLTDEFEQALAVDGDWELVFPDTLDPDYDRLWDGNLRKWKGMGKPVVVYQRLKARELWRQIVEAAWASAEPGIVRLDYCNRMSNSWYFAPLISTNPCVTGDTRIFTSEGPRRAVDLYLQGEAPEVVCDPRLGGEHLEGASRVFTTGIKPVFRLVTSEGFEIRLTADHRVLTEERGWVEAKDLRQGEQILLLQGGGAFGNEGSLELGRVLGWLVGDGTMKSDRAVLSFFGEEKIALAPAFAEMVNEVVRAPHSNRDYHVGVIEVEGRDEARVQSVRLLEIARSFGLDGDKRQVPEAVWKGTREMQIGFLQALFTADGHVEHDSDQRTAVVLTSTSVWLLQEVQQLLLNLGVYSRVFRHRHQKQVREVPDGHGGRGLYQCHATHDLRITGESLVRFASEIGFLTAAKQRKLEAAISSCTRGPYPTRWTATFERLEPDGEEVVFDLTVPGTHAFAANGLVVHNCAEQPLPGWGVCLLGHLNLARFVTDGGQVDWEELRRAARLGVRFLDDIIDITPYFFEENEHQQKLERRVGMGTMGLAEMLIRLGIRYGSQESLAFVDELYGFIAREAYLASAELAREKGPFPAFEADKFLLSGFMRMMPEEVREQVRRYGIRNVTLLTQAPTGTTGTMVGTSTGIEPYYAWSYWRYGRLGRKEIVEPVVEEWFEQHPEAGRDLQKLPPHFVTALELTPEEHIRMQAAIQRWVDAALSKTANVPSHYTVEQTMALYELALKLGCKGVTIYRDRSRDQQVLTVKEEAPGPQEAPPPQAPEAAFRLPPEARAVGPGTAQPALAVQQGATGAPSPEASGSPVALGAGGVEGPSGANGGTLGVEPSTVIGEVPEEVRGVTYRQKTLVGTARVVVNEYPEGQPFETIIVLGKGGMDITADAEAIGRLISLYLRTPSPISNLDKLALVVEQLRHIGGAQPFGIGPNKVLSMPDALAKALERYLTTRRRGASAAHPAEPGQAPAGSRSGPSTARGAGTDGDTPAIGGLEGSDPSQRPDSGFEAPPSGFHPPSAVGTVKTRPGREAEPTAGSRTSSIASSAPAPQAPAATERSNGYHVSLAGADICPLCGQTQYVRIEGCGFCHNCGYTRC